MIDLTKGQTLFLDQMTRKLLVGWCDKSLQGVRFMEVTEIETKKEHKVYLEYAQKKGFVSADGTRILAKGWQAATSFLKR